MSEKWTNSTKFLSFFLNVSNTQNLRSQINTELVVNSSKMDDLRKKLRFRNFSQKKRVKAQNKGTKDKREEKTKNEFL